VSITSLTTANVRGGTAGKIEAGDTITVTFSGQIDASTVCSGWTNGSSGAQMSGATVSLSSISGTNPNDLLTLLANPSGCTSFNFGSIDLGAAYYAPPGNSQGNSDILTFSNSSISYDGTAHKLLITLNGMSSPGSEPTVPSSTLTLNLSNLIKDTSGGSLTSYIATGSPTQQF